MLTPIFGLIAVFLGTSLAQNAFPSDLNHHFFPENVEEEIEQCTIPPYQDSELQWTPEMALGLCDNVTDDILNDTEIIQSLAEQYAPFLYFHPRESYTMSSVNRTFGEPSQGRVLLDLNGLQEFDPELQQESLLATTRDRNHVMHSHKFYFEHNLSESYLAGDGFDDEGRSLAPIYFKPFDSGNGTLTLNYFMYYAWNGPANAVVLTSFNEDLQVVRLTVPPFGVHEGDWETLSVTVCKHEKASQPLALTYRQHGFGQVLDCTEGECTFHRDSETHPVGFVARGNHDVYPFSAKEVVTNEVFPVEFFFNLQGILITDRTAYADRAGNYRYFEPDDSNVLRLAEQDSIPANVNESEYWGAFGGRWGTTKDVAADLNGTSGDCLDDDALDEVECPPPEENPLLHDVFVMLGIENSTVALLNAARDIRSFFRQTFPYSSRGPFGPASNAFYSQFRSPSNAQLWELPNIPSNMTAESYCLSLLEPTDPEKFISDIDVVPLSQNVLGILCMCIFFTILNIIYFLAKRNQDVHAVLLTDEEGRYQKPERETRRWVFLHAWIYTVAYAVTLIGSILFFVGYTALTELLEQTFTSINFKAVEIMFLALGLFILMIDSLLLIILWLRTEDLWRRINTTYFEIVGDKGNRSRFDPFEKRCCYNTEAVDVVYLTTFALLLVSLILAVIMVIVAIFNIGFAYAFGQLCEDTSGAIDGVCFRWDALGVEDVRCGSEFQDFCNEWNRKEMSATLWGAFIVICGHFYLIASGGMVALSNRSVKRALLLYPSHEEYVKFLEKLDSGSIGGSFKPSFSPNFSSQTVENAGETTQAVPESARQSTELAAEHEGQDSGPKGSTVSDFFSGLFRGGSNDTSHFANENR